MNDSQIRYSWDLKLRQKGKKEKKRDKEKKVWRFVDGCHPDGVAKSPWLYIVTSAGLEGYVQGRTDEKSGDIR